MITVSKDKLREVLRAMEATVVWRKTGVGRPPEQLMMDEIEVLRSMLEPRTMSQPELPEPTTSEFIGQCLTFPAAWSEAQMRAYGESCYKKAIEDVKPAKRVRQGLAFLSTL